MSSDSMKNFLLDTNDSKIVLDERIKIRGGWVAQVNFICENICKNANTINEKPGIPNKF